MKNNPSNKYASATISRLYELYNITNRIDDIIILSETYDLDKSKKKNYISLISKIANSIGISFEVFSNITKLTIKTDEESNQKLMDIYLKNSNIMLLNYIFAIKLKKGEYNFIDGLFKQIPEISPILRIIYLIKINSSDLRYEINHLIQNETDDTKREIYFLYGVYLTKNKRFKEGIRFFKMSISYSKPDKLGNSPKSVLEISKSLYIKGYYDISCDFIENKKFNFQSESDDFMRIYCNPEMKNELSKLKPALKIAALRDNNLVFKRYLNDL